MFCPSIPRIHDQDFVEIDDDIIVLILNFDTRCSILADLMVGTNVTAFLLSFILRIGFVRIPDTIVCLGPSVWLFSPARDAIELTLAVDCIYPFLVIDPTD